MPFSTNSNRSIKRRLQVEELEDRRLLATLTVSDLGDSGPGTLREAMLTANANSEVDAIVFSVPGTINIHSQLPTITEELTIDGNHRITIDAGNGADGVFNTDDGFGIFHIDDGQFTNIDGQFTTIDVQLTGLTLTGAENSAISNAENLRLNRMVVTRNAANNGGGLANLTGTSRVDDSTFSYNTARETGGAIANFGNLFMFQSTISGNSAAKSGGGIRSLTGIIWSSTITENVAGEVGGIEVDADLDLNNSIVSGNNTMAGTASNLSFRMEDPYVGLSGNFNLLGTGGRTDGENNITGVDDPQLGPLADNGSMTQTHAIGRDSPALFAGTSISTGFRSQIDDFSVDYFVQNYSFVPLNGEPINEPQISQGKAHLNVGGGAAAFVWNQGERLTNVGDYVSIDLGFNYPISNPRDSGIASAGLAFFGGSDGTDLLAEILVETDVTDGSSAVLNDNANEPRALTRGLAGPLTLRVEVTKSAESDPANPFAPPFVSLRTTLTGRDLVHLEREVSLLGSNHLYFGLIANNVSGNDVSYENLSTTIQFDQRGRPFERYNMRPDIGAFELQSDGEWHNPFIRYDVNNDNLLTPLDALQVINELNDRIFAAPTDGTLPSARPNGAGFLDVTGSGAVVPLDALTVINRLNELAKRETAAATQASAHDTIFADWTAALKFDNGLSHEDSEDE